MCGIAGYAGPDAAARAEGVRTALDRLRPRGPDGEGWYQGDGVVLGMRRLAIIGLVGGDQPVSDPAGRRVVVCNGEIYNHVELRRTLAERHAIRSTSDVAVIPPLAEEEPERFPAHLRGMFALALWDVAARRLTLARDLMGKKPLHWAPTREGGVAFASELPALLAILGETPPLDAVALHHYLALGAIPGPRTAYQGVHTLPPAFRLDLTPGGAPQLRRWAGRPPAPAARRPLRETLDAIDAALAEAVALRLRSDVPLGVMLSGGIDSGLVAACAARAGARGLAAYVVRAGDPALDEGALARRTAERYGLALTEITLDAVGPDLVRAVARSHGQPFGDSSAVPSWLLARAIAPERKVVLNGDGGDEIFAGYRRYSLARWLGALGGAPLPVPRGVARRGVGGFLRRAARIRRAPAEERYQLLTTDLLTAAPMARYFPALATDDACADLARHLPADPLADGGGALMRADRELLLAWDLLPKMDIATMSHGLEARSPFLDQEVVALATALPPAQVVGWTRTKPLLRALAARHLPAQVVRAPKRGFEGPVAAWLAGPLRPLVEETLLARDARVAALAVDGAIRRLVDGAASFDGNRPQLVWALLMLELFLRG